MKDQCDDPSHHEWTLLPQSYISINKTYDLTIKTKLILKPKIKKPLLKAALLHKIFNFMSYCKKNTKVYTSSINHTSTQPASHMVYITLVMYMNDFAEQN